MDRTQRLLAAAFAIQVVLLALLYHPWVRTRETSGRALLPSLASVTPDRIEVDGADAVTATFVRRSGGWVLDDPEGYPVVPGKVEKLLQDLEHVSATRPVASDRRSHAALKVAAVQFERRIRLWAGAARTPAAELYLGSSVAYNVTHVRVGGDDHVFEASGISAYDVPADPGSWIERELVSMHAEDVTRFELTNRKGAFVLEREGGAWHVRSPAARASVLLDSLKAVELVRALCGLSIDQPAGPVDESAQGFADPEATVHLERSTTGPDSAKAGPSQVTIRIGAPAAGKPDSRYATRSGLPFAVTLPKYAYDRALTVELKELMKQ